MTFSDGTSISVDRDDVVVFVGPNNAGKTRALRDIEAHLSGATPGPVLAHVSFDKVGESPHVLAHVKRNSVMQEVGSGPPTASGLGYRLSLQNVDYFWTQQLGELTPFFCLRIATETRITGSDPVASISFIDEPTTHPVHMLHQSGALEQRISELFFQAFGQHLFVNRLGGRTIPLMVGQASADHGDSRSLTLAYSEWLRDATVALQEQGDGMRSFASVLLHLFVPTTPSLLLLDEPEAFLHPPQARYLGELIATKRNQDAQLFVATHSPDVLRGLLNASESAQVRVIRLQRSGDVNEVTELNNERAREIASDPLMKYSSILSGVFHKRVIICESDGDCMFYSALLDIPDVHGTSQPDVLFVHASGKDRMAIQARAMSSLGVPTDVIADIDVLRDEQPMERLVVALGGDWSAVSAKVRIVKAAIEHRNPPLNADSVKTRIQDALAEVSSEGAFPKEAQRKIEATLKDMSPWSAVKAAGDRAVPAGDASRTLAELREQLQDIGLWIVPVGELEGFCKAVGGKGPRWVQEVIRTHDLATAPELADAREFVTRVWTHGGGLGAGTRAARNEPDGSTGTMTG